MAMYKTHTRFNLLVALPILGVGIYYLLHPPLAFVGTFIVAFTYTTLFMNPDLDLANQIRLFSLRGLFSIPFRSYAACFRHRGLSHHFVLGSLTRIVWLLGWLFIVFFLTYKALPSQKSLITMYTQYQPFILYGLAGVCFADWAHLLLDIKEH